MSNVAVFFDVQNLYHSSKIYEGRKISYRKLLEKIGEGRHITTAKAYAAHRDGSSSKNFYAALTAAEIEVVSKKVHTKKADEEVRVIPVHFDVEISTDAMEAVFGDVEPKVDTVVLCTGNGNFGHLVQVLQEYEVNVEIWSFFKSTSETLKTLARFVPIPKECLMDKSVPEVTTNVTS